MHFGVELTVGNTTESSKEKKKRKKKERKKEEEKKSYHNDFANISDVFRFHCSLGSPPFTETRVTTDSGQMWAFNVRLMSNTAIN